MLEKYKSALKRLKEILLVNDYAILIDLFTNGRINTAPWMLCPSNMLDRLPRKQKILLQLFHLGQWIDAVNEVIDESILDVLIEMGILERNNNLWKTCEYVISPYNGLYIISQKWKPGDFSAFNQVWLGEDSLCLARLLPNIMGKRVLDLCAGTGILGMVLASRGANVTSVEINPEAVKLCKWNIIINNLEQQLQVFEGNLYEPVKGAKFDFILSNPPYIPLIEGGDAGLLFGSAGDDGLKILRAIIYEVDDYLQTNGKAVFIAGGFGDEEKPFIAEELSHYAREKGLDTNLIVYGKRKAMEELNHIEKVLPAVNKFFQGIDGNTEIKNGQYYHFILTVHKTSIAYGEFNTVFCFSSLKDTYKLLKEGRNG